jgi:hypothetical protein
LATGRTCINGLTGVPNLDTGQVQFPQQEHLLLYRITVWKIIHAPLYNS